MPEPDQHLFGGEKKMKKILLFILFLTLACPAFSDYFNRPSLGVSYHGGVYSPGYQNGLSINGKPFKIPLFIEASSNFVTDRSNVDLNIAWWLLNSPFAGTLSWYTGIGIGNKLFLSDLDYDVFVFVQLGLQLFPHDFLEFFIETRPNVGFTIQNNETDLRGGFSFYVGSRYWF